MSSDAGSGGSLQERFAALAARWQRETRHHSSTDVKIAHPAYREIVRMGEAAIPMILRELERTRAQWFQALFEITGETPFALEDHGNVEAMASAWVEWGRRSGYLD